MEIYSNDFYKIFEANFDYDIVETPLGRAIKMPARDAYIYSIITGSGYLDNPYYPYTPRGLTKLFYSAFNFKFVTGIFDNVSLLHTPYLMQQAKPFIFMGDKYIIPLEFNRDIDLTAKLESYYANVSSPEDYLIQRIEIRKNGNGMEPFLEYLTSEHFRQIGYIVETQIPLAHSTGSPDFGGYRISEAINEIVSHTALNQGFHMIELAMLRQEQKLSESQRHSSINDNCIVVGEAKTSTKTMDTQIDKYLDFGVFDKAYEITPLKQQPNSGKYGLITLSNNYKINIIEPVIARNISELTKQNEYVDWLCNYFKFYLIANLTNDEFDDYYQEQTGLQIKDQLSISNFISNKSIEDIINQLKKVSNGSI